METQPFTLDVPGAEIDDLRDRLRRTRWPEAETVDDWSQGVPLAIVKDLCRYWADEYDWTARQARINQFPQYRTTIDGLGIHFIHVPSPHAGALPLVLTHGWPGSVAEFFEVIGPLTDPEAHGGDASDAFHVVCPSLPGYGWSDKPSEPGWGVGHIGDAWATLMSGLGYDHYGAQGGDWGSAVTTALGLTDPNHVVGIHLNMATAGPPSGAAPPWDEAEQAALDGLEYYQKFDSGYSKQQSTRPQTVGYGLVDSPAGLCAWILEKFWSWSDTKGDPVGALGADRILDDVMYYWLPAAGASSGRLYWESFGKAFTEGAPPIVNVPAGISIFPKEIVRPPRAWVEPRFSDLRYWGTPGKGGHFAAFEQPELFVDEVRAFFRLVR
jgi:pimeloyl-ACP methyl ester carboxylesterase